LKPFVEIPQHIVPKTAFEEPHAEVQEDQAAFLTTFVFLVNATEEAEPIVSIIADTEITYRRTHGGLSNEDSLRRWVVENGAFHAWPFWRELVQAALARMDLPPIRLPLVYQDDLPTFIIRPDTAERERAVTQAKKKKGKK